MPDKSALQIIREELPQFWQGEQAAGMRGMVKGLGDLFGISSLSEPESVMSRYPSEENAVRSLTPIAAATIPLSKAVAPLTRFATRNPLATGAAMTYLTEDPTMLAMNPATILGSYTPEAEAVVKPKGGNWLNGIEKALNRLKANTSVPVTDLMEELATYRPGSESYNRVMREIGMGQRNESLNQWIGGPLTKYAKTYLGTAEDPVRKLAEQGILHTGPEQLNIVENWKPTEGQVMMGKSPMARAWEGASDLNIATIPVEDVPPRLVRENEWVSKLQPQDKVHALLDWENANSDLGFTHLRDELRNALNPESGLPASLLLQPEDMKQMGMEKAVRHVAAINAWRDAQKAEADLAKATNAATHTVKEYPEGYKLVELAPPKSQELNLTFEPTTEGVRVFDKAGNQLKHPGGWNVFKSPEEARAIISEDRGIKSLEDALKYEGETMGHCVGGYCEDVSKGRSRIFSIRDAKGRPHVTIETSPPQVGYPREEFKTVSEMTPAEFEVTKEHMGSPASLSQEEAVRRGWLVHPQVPYFVPEEYLKPQIVQIKGKGNKAPAAKYQEMVQDFVRSQDWGRIGDLENTGLLKGPEGKLLTRPEMLQQYEALPDALKNTGFVQERINWLKTQDETPNYNYQDALDYLRQAHPEHFAQGGSIQPAHFDNLEAFLSRQ